MDSLEFQLSICLHCRAYGVEFRSFIKWFWDSEPFITLAGLNAPDKERLNDTYRCFVDLLSRSTVCNCLLQNLNLSCQWPQIRNNLFFVPTVYFCFTITTVNHGKVFRDWQSRSQLVQRTSGRDMHANDTCQHADILYLIPWRKIPF